MRIWPFSQLREQHNLIIGYRLLCEQQQEQLRRLLDNEIARLAETGLHHDPVGLAVDEIFE